VSGGEGVVNEDNDQVRVCITNVRDASVVMKMKIGFGYM
jgi:hypothetical protein